MKFAIYETRDDELNDLKAYEKEFNIENQYIEDTLNKNTIQLCKGMDGVSILGQSQINQEMIDLLIENNIKVLTTRTIGYNHIDIKYAKEKGLHVANSIYDPDGVADYTVMFILMVLRRYKPSMWRAHVYDFSLKGLQGKELRSMTVGIIGTGRIGLSVMKRLVGFGCKILCYDAYQNEEATAYGQYVNLETLYKECDIISFHTPLLESTYHMVNCDSLQMMKDGVILINCARGELMDIDILIDGLESKKIGALGLDTVETEEGLIHQNRVNDILTNRRIAYLRQFPNVIMTSHMAFYTQEAVRSMVYYGLLGLIEMTQGHFYMNEL